MILKLLKLAIQRFNVGRPPTRVGQVVTLSDKCPYTPSEEFPIEGTSYECGGVVHTMNRRQNVARVDWYNDYMTELRLDTLRVLSDVEHENLMKRGFVADNPNFTFKHLMSKRKKKKKKTNAYEPFIRMASGSGNYDGEPPDIYWDD